MKKNTVFLLFLVILFLNAMSLASQTMDILDSILASDEVSYGKAAYLVAVGSRLSDDNIAIDKACSIINEKGWNTSELSADEPIPLGDICFMTMQALDLDGGIMYHLLPSPRYALREFAYLGIISPQSQPDSTVSGRELIHIISQAIDQKESK